MKNISHSVKHWAIGVMRLDIRIMRFPSKKPQLFRISWKKCLCNLCQYWQVSVKRVKSRQNFVIRCTKIMLAFNSGHNLKWTKKENAIYTYSSRLFVISNHFHAHVLRNHTVHHIHHHTMFTMSMFSTQIQLPFFWNAISNDLTF